MGKTTAQTIAEITKNHLLNNNGLLFGQCLTAVGWIGGTVPSDLPNNKGLIELPTSDVSNSGIVVGAALAGRRPIYAIRYQGFLTFNGANLFNYAAKSKDLWNIECPIFIRAIGMEGQIGPVASNSFHGLAMKYPGIKVRAPLTPGEYQDVWDEFMNGDYPVFCSETRKSYNIDYETSPTEYFCPKTENWYDYADIVIIAIGNSRLETIKAAEILGKTNKIHLYHLINLKPLELPRDFEDSINEYTTILIVDCENQIAGTAEHIAYELGLKTNRFVHCLGLADKTAGFSKNTDNLTPSSEQIIEYIKNI